MTTPTTTMQFKQWWALANTPVPTIVSRIRCLWLMSANGNRATYGMHPSVFTKGYVNGFYPEQMRPVLERGFDTMTHLHSGDDSPWENGAPMNGDARNEAVARGLTAILDFGDMLELMEMEFPERTHNAYVGSLWDVDIGHRILKGDFNAFEDYLRKAFLDIRNRRNCDVTVDHSATIRRGYEIEKGGNVRGFPPRAWSALWAYLGLLRAEKAMQGRRVYLEAMPHRDTPYMHDWDCCAVDRVGALTPFETTRPPDDELFAGSPHSTWATPTQRLTGRLLRLDLLLGKDHPYPLWVQRGAKVLATDTRTEWAAAFSYTRGTAEQFARDVLDYAAAQVDRLLAGTDPTNPDDGARPSGDSL